MAILTSQHVTQAGLAPSYATAAGGGDKFAPGNNVFVHVKNGGGSPVDVTFDSKTPSNYGTDENLVVSVPASGERMVGPFSAGRFAGTDGLVDVSYSGVTSVTVAVVRV
jgi:hypothetical protein